MKHIKRISLIVVAVLVLACSVPLSSLAVDPVSAATMANALAQAITAYGASQGVSMTFDVANTDGIGEGVHELWDQYQEDMANSSVTVSDYQNLAASAFPTLWIKIGQKIGVNLDAASVGEIDGFWNWLLSGPAEMQKVDDQYYEWTVSNGTVTPINVITVSGSPFWGQPYSTYTTSFSVNNGTTAICNLTSNNGVFFAVKYDQGYPNTGSMWAYSDSNTSSATWVSNGITKIYMPRDTVVVNGVTYYYDSSTGNPGGWNGMIQGLPAYQRDTGESVNHYLTKVITDIWVTDYPSDYIDIQPYVGDTAPQNVYIPDNTDVNYEPVPASIPTDISWDDTLFGDGTGTLTDAQSEAITQAVDQAIVDNPAKTIELADTTPPAPSPSEVYIPFLPVTLPSFNFSLSGIWHYVTAWVASLGAWFSLVFTTWSYLPYAISVPVYATAVIVIVLGVYKRFFM